MLVSELPAGQEKGLASSDVKSGKAPGEADQERGAQI